MPDSDYTGVRPEQKVLKVDGIAQSLTGNNKADGLFKIYDATADVPAANTFPNGTVVIDAEASKLQVVVAGAYLSATLS